MSKTVSKFAFTAGLVLAVAFVFSCSDDDGDGNIGTCGGKKYDTTVYSCEKGEIVGYCKGNPYYPEYQNCDNNGEIKEGAEISSSSLRNSSSSGGGLKLSDLPKQVYFVEIDYDDNDNLIIRKKERYEGNSNIAVYFSDIVEQSCSGSDDCVCTNTKGEVFKCGWDYEYDTIPAGKIQNGQLSLNLPANVNSKYLRKLEPCDDEYCQSNISVVPRNLTYTRRSSLDASIPGERECWIRPYRTKSGTTNRAQFYYFSESGSITGTETYTEPDYYSQTNFDMNFSKGWNLVYYDDYESNQNHNSYRRTLTTDIPKDGTWEWWLQCDNYDYPDPSSSSGGNDPYGTGACYTASTPISGVQLCIKVRDGITAKICEEAGLTYREYCPSNPILICEGEEAVYLYGTLPSGSNCGNIFDDIDDTPSSSSLGGGYTGSYGSLNYEGQTYKTVVIGIQTWMAENLNYAAAGSKCYDNDPANCVKYGLLYNWPTAMALPSSCNSDFCSDQIQSPHRGICPEGWHIPSNADWDKLYSYADGTSGTSSPYDSPTAGKHLKAQSGWNPYSGIENLDTYGFSALPGGYGGSGGSFYDVGSNGYWWGAGENEDYSFASYYRRMYYSSDDAYWGSSYKFYLYSVRCLQD